MTEKRQDDTVNHKTVSLVVENALPSDMHRGIARIDWDSMDALGVSTHSVIEIIGKKRAVARILGHYPSDDGKKMIRIDELTKENAGATTNQSVTLRKISSLPAEEVAVIPLTQIPPGSETYLRDYLEGQPMTKEQKLMVPYFSEWWEFKVLDHNPSCDAVHVTSKTKFCIQNTTMEGLK